MKININEHALKRYAERVVGVKDWKEANRYVAMNKDRIETHIKKMFEYSEYLGKAQIGNNVTRKFYTSGNFLIVTAAKSDSIVTIMKKEEEYVEKILSNKLEEIS